MHMPYPYYGQPDQKADQTAALANSGPPLAPVRWGAMRAIRWAAVPVAMGISYSRNKSIPWALGAGLVPRLYLVYMGLQAAAGNKVIPNPKRRRKRRRRK